MKNYKPKPFRPLPHLVALLAEVEPGTCICCEYPLPASKGGRPRIICTSPSCKTLYHRLYGIARRERDNAS